MATIPLLCWVYREAVKNIFPVEIPENKTVGTLKEIIKSKKFVRFRDVEADQLELYSIRLASGDGGEQLKDKLEQLSLEGKSYLTSQTKLSRLFPGSDTEEVEWLIVADGPNYCAPLSRHYFSLLIPISLVSSRHDF